MKKYNLQNVIPLNHASMLVAAQWHFESQNRGRKADVGDFKRVERSLNPL